MRGRKPTKKAKPAIKQPLPEEKPAVVAPKKPGLKYFAITIGRNQHHRWATVVDTIEDGKVIHRERVVEDSTKGSALDRLKITVARRFLRTEQRVI